MEGGAVGHNIERGHPRTIPAKFALIWFSGFRGEDLNVIPPFSINFRCQIENQVSDYRLLGASSFFLKSVLSFFSSFSYDLSKLQ
jgi:hypothetical protein